MPDRISKILSASGVASRREAERMISQGRVFVNGKAAEIGQSAEASIDEITVDGVLIKPEVSHVYIMLNKPTGYITTVSDDRGRKTVMELVSNVGVRVYPVGRLDMDSQGLLLMTNDGLFANALTHPSYNKPKTYEVKVSGNVDKALPLLRLPIIVDDREICAVAANSIKKTAAGGILRITINEGRNRQIRKMCAACGLDVQSLTRVCIGTLELGLLDVGKWRHLTESERKALCEVS
ncbi:MAG: rRNA pseudouridine synthase [Oscillospiraceae bacterium]|nr:rRNA pseudouridine synthase [Oscillospiraceae bacterium]